MNRIALATTLTLLVCGAVFGLSAPVAAAARCEAEFLDGGSYRFDFAYFFPADHSRDEYGAIVDGGSAESGETPSTADGYDNWGNGYVLAAGADVGAPAPSDKYVGPAEACALNSSGREIAYPVVAMHGLQVQRRWFVDSGALHGARILTVLHNPGAAPVAMSVLFGDPDAAQGSLGSEEQTIVQASSDGSKTFSTSSVWAVTSDSSLEDLDPALAHVWDGSGGAIRAGAVVQSNDMLYFAWKDIAVAPGATVALVSYEIQNAVLGRDPTAEVAGAVAQAEAHEKQPPASLYAGMTAAEIAGTLNWPRPTGVTAAIAPIRNANAAQPVLLDGSPSVNTVAGLPQCAPTYAWTADGQAIPGSAQLSRFFAPGKHTVELSTTNSCGGVGTTKTTITVASGLRLGKARFNPKTHSGSIKVKALGAGALTLEGKGLKRQRKAVKKPGVVTLLLRPTGSVAAKLARGGRAKVKIRVTLLPKGGRPSRATKALVLDG